MTKKEKKITSGVRVSFFIPTDWYIKIKQVADRDKIPVTIVLRTAVKEYLENHNMIEKG